MGRLTVEFTIVLAVARSNAPSVLEDAATVYKVDTDAIALKVRQEFAAKEKTQTAKRSVTKAQPKAVKKANVA